MCLSVYIGKESTRQCTGCAGDTGSIPGLGRSPGEGNGNPLQYSYLENSIGQRNMVGLSPWGRKGLGTDEWMSMHTCSMHNGILLSHKKEWNITVCDHMHGPRDYHYKWYKPEKDKYNMISLICRILTNNTNQFIYKTETVSQTENKFVVTKGERECEG